MGRYREPYTIFQRGKYWYYRTYDSNGVRTVPKSTGCTSKNKAREYCNNLWRAGELWSSNKTFGEYARHFYDDDGLYCRDRIIPIAENTISNYRKQLKNKLMPFFEHRKLCDITYSTLKEFRASMIADNLSSSYVTNSMSALKHILDYAYRDRLIPSNPYQLLEPIKMPTKERDAFTLSEVIKLYNLIPEEFQKTIKLMALTGMRISEAVGVTDSDVIQAEGFIYIDLNKQLIKNKYQPLKNREARAIPITSEIRELIGFEPLRLSAFYREFNKIKNNFDRAEERLLSFHSLRHFFITNTKAEGVNDIKIEFIAGHTLKGISKVYTNFKPEDLLDVIPWQKETYKKISLE